MEMRRNPTKSPRTSLLQSEKLTSLSAPSRATCDGVVGDLYRQLLKLIRKNGVWPMLMSGRSLKSRANMNWTHTRLVNGALYT